MPDDNPPGNPPVPVCPKCHTQHYPASPCPGDDGGEGKDP